MTYDDHFFNVRSIQSFRNGQLTCANQEPIIQVMQPVNELRFAISDRINNAEIGPKHVPLNLLSDFQKEVGDFLKGASRDVDPAQVLISVEDGSFMLVATGLLAASTLWADLERLKSPESLGLIDSKRAIVVERWQAAARQNPRRKYMVTDAKASAHVTVDSSSDFRKVEDVWVRVEKYLEGRIVDLGGKTKANVHLEIDGGDVIVVAATTELLAREEQNRLYRPATLHVSAETSLLTGELRDFRLLAFQPDHPAYDETEFQVMVSRGNAAWADVQNPTEWLEILRGNIQ